MRNDEFERDEMNAIQRERMERRRNTHRKSLVTTIVFASVGVLVLGGIIFGAAKLIGGNNKDKNTAPTSVTATISTEAKTPTTPAQSGSTAATQSNERQAQQGQQATQAPQAFSTDAPIGQSATTASGDPYNTGDPALNGNGDSQTGNSGSAVEGGNVLHYYANGQTSYGYDWTYSGGGGIVSIYCTYDFDSKQYDFTVTGVSEGTTSFTLYYNTADGVQVPVPMTVSVDSNLNVTQIG